MSRTIQILAAAGFIAILFTLAGTWDYADALSTDADVKNLRARVINDHIFAPQAPTVIGQGYSPEPSPVALSHPLPYQAIVCQAGSGEPRRCYYYTGAHK